MRPKLLSIEYEKVVYYEINEIGEEEEVEAPTSTSFSKIITSNDKIAAKGTKATVKETHLRHQHFVDTLKNLSTYDAQQNLLRSKNHIVSSGSVKKVSLNAFDTKRWIQDDGIHTLAHGHWRTFR